MLVAPALPVTRRMRHLTRDDIRALGILRAAKTIAVLTTSARLADRSRTTIAFLRREGYDVIVLPLADWRARLEATPGAIDILLIFGSADEAVLDAAAARRIGALWIARGGALADTLDDDALARLSVITNHDIVDDLTHMRREAGEPRKLGVHLARRKTTPVELPRGYMERGGGGKHGGGGGRAAIDEKKMTRRARRRNPRRAA